MDDDLQNPPEELPRLLKGFESGADVVYGSPHHASHGLARKLSSRVTRWVLKEVMGADGAQIVSPYRAFRSTLRDGFAQASGPTINIDVLLSWTTTRFHRVSVNHDERRTGHSNYTFRKLVHHTLNLLTGFSTRPLRVASLTGFAFTITGIAIFAYVFGHYLFVGGSVPGFAFLASIICVFSGAQLFTIGIIGEYLARMFHRMMDMPSYFIGRSTPHNGVAESGPD